MLHEFSLFDAKDKYIWQFSGGMRRRLDLAVSLISKPKLIFLDEPTTGLDPRTRIQIWNTLKQLVSEGSTLILTTQYLEEAEQLADNIAIIDKGEVKAFGTPNELKEMVREKTSAKDPSMDDVFFATTEENEQERNKTKGRRDSLWMRPRR